MNKKSIILLTLLALTIIIILISISMKTAELPIDLKNEDIMQKTNILMQTSKGDIEIELFNEDAPITTNNFIKLIEDGFYNGLIFHRVINGFMIQGGCPDGTGMGGPDWQIQDEFISRIENNRGTLSMANSGPNTGGSQFFINLVDNNYLDGKHTVFGKVIQGMEIVDSIAAVQTGANDRPLEDVIIEKITIKK